MQLHGRQLAARCVLFTLPLEESLAFVAPNIPMKPRLRGTSVPAFLTAKVHETHSFLNATREAEAQKAEGSLSSAVALLVVLILLFCLVSVSLATYCFHKWKLRSKTLQKAHEEYQKDYEKRGHQTTSSLV